MINSLITIAIVILLINGIINYNKITICFNKIKFDKGIDICWKVFEILLIIIICIILINKGMESIELLQMQIEIDKDIEEISKHQQEESEYYKKAIEADYKNQKYDEPYIPKGFEYVEGTWNTGYVIQDENENQYVWIPCTNKDIAEVTKLARRNFVNNAYMSKDLCYDPECEDFIRSALENGGYYIARFEIGQEDNKAVSKKNTKIWTYINKEEAKEVIKQFDNSGIRISLMNSYSYDTAFEWIINTNEEVTYGIIKSDQDNNRYTGNKEYNNIYDLFDTTYEMTTEIYSEHRVISRGPSGIYNDIMNEENIKRLDNRGSILWEKADNLAFRTILYK